MHLTNIPRLPNADIQPQCTGPYQSHPWICRQFQTDGHAPHYARAMRRRRRWPSDPTIADGHNSCRVKNSPNLQLPKHLAMLTFYRPSTLALYPWGTHIETLAFYRKSAQTCECADLTLIVLLLSCVCENRAPYTKSTCE
jgi:hypothetical protein